MKIIVVGTGIASMRAEIALSCGGNTATIQERFALNDKARAAINVYPSAARVLPASA